MLFNATPHKIPKKEGIMRTVKTALIALLLIGLASTQAKAKESTVNGLVIGAAVGSIMGFIVGNEMYRNGYRAGQVDHRSVHYGPPLVERRPISYRNHPPQVFGYNRQCRETVVIRERHGHYRETIKTICREKR